VQGDVHDGLAKDDRESSQRKRGAPKTGVRPAPHWPKRPQGLGLCQVKMSETISAGKGVMTYLSRCYWQTGIHTIRKGQ
jgi:hypothetical protein